MTECKVGDRFNDNNPGRDGKNISYKITKIFSPEDEEVKNGTHKVGDIKYVRTDGRPGGGIVDPSYANSYFRRISHTGMPF